MSNIANKGATTQGPWGASRTKGNGSHLEPAKDVKRRGPTGDHLSPLNPATRASGDHLSPGPNVPGTDKTAQRGGGGVRGNDRTNPSAGKSRSGSKDAQHPNNKR